MKEIIDKIDFCSLDDLLAIERAVRKAKRKFPKHEYLKTQKPIDPVAEFRLSCHRLCKYWLNNNGHADHAWDSLQNKGLNGIIDKIKFALSKREDVVTQESVLHSFSGMMINLPDFYANKIDFDMFDRKFNAIVSEIRSMKNGRNKSITETGQPQPTERFSEAAQRIAARHAGK